MITNIIIHNEWIIIFVKYNLKYKNLLLIINVFSISRHLYLSMYDIKYVAFNNHNKCIFSFMKFVFKYIW